MIPTAFKLVFSTSLIILSVSACTKQPIKATTTAGNVSYDHTQRNRINKQKYINRYQQAYIRTQNSYKKTAPHQRARKKGRSTPTSKRSPIKQAKYTPRQKGKFQKVGYNNQARNLKSTWWQVHNGFKFKNYNHKSKVRQYVRSYSRIPKRMSTLSHRSSPYLPTITAEIRRRGMPTEIALLPFVESAFNTNAYSPAKAAGLWQFIPDTARRYGLPVSSRYDARYNWKASTNAALSYLQDLNRQFKGDWLLSLAAYNCGEARVHREMAKNRARGLPTDFWNLRLPKETRNYVPRLLAFKEIYSNPKAYGVNIAYIPTNPKASAVVHKTSPKNRSSRKKQRAVTHRVKMGDTLYHIAKRYNTSVHKIMRMNGLKSTKIRLGKHLKIASSKKSRHYG